MTQRTSIVLLGSMGVAVECLDWLLAQPSYDVLGVVCSLDPISAWRRDIGDRNMAEEAPKLGIPVFTLDDVPSADIGLSVRFHQILRRRHLDRFRLGVVNLHGAPLPEMRGSMWEHVALYEGRPYYGSSLHWIDEGIDSGPVLICRRFPIAPGDCSLTLLQKANAVGLELIEKHLAAIVRGEMAAVPQVGGRYLTTADARALLAGRRAA